jgi:hypothetical protein
MTDICERARIAYNAGIDPIDYAETELSVLIGVHLSLASMCTDLDVPAPEGALTVGALSRRIVAAIWDAGWTPPEVTK